MARALPPPTLDDAPLAAGLYVVATPIGNLRDITLRALDVLAQADVVLAEDTRVTGKLLSHFGLSAKLAGSEPDKWGPPPQGTGQHAQALPQEVRAFHMGYLMAQHQFFEGKALMRH